MYGLTHRIENDALQGDVVEPSPLVRISSLGAPATVMVIDRAVMFAVVLAVVLKV